MIVLVEIFRDGAWRETSISGHRVLDHVGVAVDRDGEILVDFRVGYLFPPWRVSVDGTLLFERQA